MLKGGMLNRILLSSAALHSCETLACLHVQAALVRRAVAGAHV